MSKQSTVFLAVSISATAPAGKSFVEWTGDIAHLADGTSATTTVTMPAEAVNVTATFSCNPLDVPGG